MKRSELRLIEASPYARLARLTPEILDEVSQLAVGWLNPGQPFGIVERGADISGSTIECDERQQGVAIGGMPRQAILSDK
jgi:hypothetical protein